MRLVLLSLLAFPALAQLIPGIPDAALMRPPLPRAGLVAGWDLRGFNLLRFSEALDNSAWGKVSGTTITADAALSPTGTQTADRIVALNAAAGDRVSQEYLTPLVASGTYTASVWLKGEGANVGKPVQITIKRAPGGSGTFTATVETYNLTADWVRVSATVTLAADNVGVGLYLGCGNTATCAADVLVWGAQLNQGPTPLPYVATGDLQTVANLVPGGAALQRGSASGADTNDPTPTLAGWSFDGVDDYGTASAAGFPTGDGNLTMVAIAQSSATTGFMNVVGYGPAIANQSPGFRFENSATNVNFYSYGAGYDRTVATGHGTGYNSFVGVWQTGGRIQPYMNAVAIAASPYSGPTNWVNTTPLRVGAQSGATLTNFFNGTISFIFVYNRALTPAEIKRLHERFLKPKMAEVSVTLP